jgi:hypothetical protein
MWGALTILKAAVPGSRAFAVTLICVSARPARCSANIPTLAEVQPSDRRSLDRLLEGQVVDDANLFSEKLQEWEDYCNYTALTALLAAKHLTSAFVRKPKTRCHGPSSVAQSDERAHCAIK